MPLCLRAAKSLIRKEKKEKKINQRKYIQIRLVYDVYLSYLFSKASCARWPLDRRLLWHTDNYRIVKMHKQTANNNSCDKNTLTKNKSNQKSFQANPKQKQRTGSDNTTNSSHGNCIQSGSNYVFNSSDPTDENNDKFILKKKTKIRQNETIHRHRRILPIPNLRKSNYYL